MKTALLTKVVPCALFLSLPSLKAQNLVLMDDMTDTSYSEFSFNGFDSGSNPDDVSFAFWDTESSGGNPGSVFNVFHEHDVDRDGFGDPVGATDASLQSFFVNDTFSYTPSSQGAINSLSFSLDVKTSDLIDSVYFFVGDSLGGTVAQGFTGDGFLSITQDGEWQTLTLSGVTQADLGSRDLSGSLPLEFGFGFLSNTDVSGGAETFFLQADNFIVEIDAIPEPSSVLLLSLGMLGILGRRR